jgi:hypothetical protein
MWKNKNEVDFGLRSLVERDHLEELGVDGITVLNGLAL